MARQLKPSPLPNRIAPTPLLRNWMWLDDRSYDGVVVPIEKEKWLLPFLAHKGTLLKIDGFYCFVFDIPVSLDPIQLGPVMSVRIIGGTTFSTYDLGATPLNGTSANRLHIVRDGRPMSYNLNAAIPIDPLQFWNLTGLDVVASKALPKRDRASSRASKPPPQVPRQNASLSQIVQARPIYDDVRNAVDAVKSDGEMGHFRRSVRIERRLVLSLFIIFIAFTGLFGGLGAVTNGTDGGLLSLLATIFILFGLWWLLFSGRRARGHTGKATESVYRKPGLLDRLTSWVLWNTRSGDRLRAEISRHIDDVNRMIKNGEIDRALKRALSLGAQRAADAKRRVGGPTSLPKPRATLDMDLSGIQRLTASVLDDGSFREMAEQYRKLAQKLSADGDHKRAAFIYSELLSDVPQALSELEKLKAFEDAAKLATARKSPEHIAARLWFLAGRKDIALALAKRYDGMEFVANAAEKTDPEFAAFVRGHWIKDLIMAGDLSGAVAHSAGRPALESLHVTAIKQAVLAGLLDEAPILVAATITLDWRSIALNDDFIGSANDALQELEMYLHRLVHDGDTKDAAARHALITGLVSQKPKEKSKLDAFWTDRALLLSDGLIRASLAYDTDAPSTASLAELRRIAKEMGLTVLAEDLRHVVRSEPKKPRQKRTFPLPPAAATTWRRWTMIACVANRQTLVSADNGELALLDPNGKRRWSDQMNALVGIVPIGPGRLVILVQEDGAEKRLTLLDTALHSYRDLGRVALARWHQTANAATWLVQTSQAIGGLDVSTLLEDTPRFDFLWSIAQTVPVVVLGFQVSKPQIKWITQRVENGAPGLIEVWTLYVASEKLSVAIIDPAALDGRQVYQSQHLWTAANQFWPTTQPISHRSQPEYCLLRLSPYDFQNEQKVISNSRAFFNELVDFAQVIPTSGQDVCALNDQSQGSENLVMWQQKNQSFIILEGTTVDIQVSHSSGRRLALIDDHQRIIICDLDAETVTVGLP